MKNLIFTLIILFSTNVIAIAQVIPLQEGDGGFTYISGEVTVVKPKPTCPAGAECAIISQVNIRYTLGGCLDRFAGAHKVVANQDGTFDVFVTSMRIANEKSLVAFCVAEPQFVQKIFLSPGVIAREKVRVHFLGTPEKEGQSGKFVLLTEEDVSMVLRGGNHEVLEKSPSCGLGMLCAQVQSFELQIRAALGSCVNRAETSHRVIRNNDGTVDVYVTLLDIVNKQSPLVKCLSHETNVLNIGLGHAVVTKEQVRVHYLGVLAGGIE